MLKSDVKATDFGELRKYVKDNLDIVVDEKGNIISGVPLKGTVKKEINNIVAQAATLLGNIGLEEFSKRGGFELVTNQINDIIADSPDSSSNNQDNTRVKAEELFK